jgi:hypothetical protein
MSTKKKPVETLESLRAENLQLKKIIEMYKMKKTFIYRPGRETMVVKIGSVTANWLPGPAHFAAVTSRIKHAGLDEKYNIILVHALTTFEKIA